MMKFLVIVTPRQVPLPPGVIADLLEAQKAWLNEQIANGTLESVHGIVGGAGVGIANVDSHEQMHALLVSSPAFPLADYDVRAIGDFAANIDAGVASLRRAASMMPGPPG
jgi:muconolactone delta-isomerase